MQPTTSEVPLHARPGAVRPFLTRLLLGWLLVLVTLAVVHRVYFFVEPWHEHSDYAVDALQIERARHFEVIHGNFSRFGFHHPGPAFYYVYALGEQVFYRWAAVVPSPYNAHALAGLILQCFFFAAALAMAAEWIRRPLFLPLALLALALHLALAGSAFISIWPPHVLLMPLFCFLVGVAAVAAGRPAHLPVTVLAGCFLVHGHVAMPLFVVVLSVLSCAVLWRQVTRLPSGRRSWLFAHRWALLLSVLCVAVFLVPLVIDLSAGSDSNAARIVEFQTTRGPGKPLWKALVYFCSFFGYVDKTEAYLSVSGPGRAAVIGEHAAGYFVWAAILTVVLASVRRIWRRPEAAQRPFVLSLTAFTFLAFLLSLYWGMAQIGPMYGYNGYFFHAILGCILLLFTAAVSAPAVAAVRFAGAALCTVALVVVWRQPHPLSSVDYSTNHIPAAVRSVLASDPLPEAPKYLLFNRNDWGEAVSIGLALNRAGHVFRADADWGPKFASDGAFEPSAPDFDLHGISIWRLSRLGPPDAGVRVRDNLRVYFQPLPFNPSDAIIDCAENGNLELYTLFGFASPLRGAAWTIRPYAGLVFDAPALASDLSVTFFAEPFAHEGAPSEQPMTLSVNGQTVFSGTLGERGTATARVSAKVWNSKKPVMMVLHLPAAVSERQLGLSLDERTFGWHIRRIGFALEH